MYTGTVSSLGKSVTECGSVPIPALIYINLEGEKCTYSKKEDGQDTCIQYMSHCRCIIKKLAMKETLINVTFVILCM